MNTSYFLGLKNKCYCTSNIFFLTKCVEFPHNINSEMKRVKYFTEHNKFSIIFTKIFAELVGNHSLGPLVRLYVNGIAGISDRSIQDISLKQPRWQFRVIQVLLICQENSISKQNWVGILSYAIRVYMN